jgi:hypothetical protein
MSAACGSGNRFELKVKTMKKLLVLSIAALVVLSLESAVWAQGEWGNLKGRIKVEGTVPAATAEEIDKDQAICMKDGVKPLDDNLVVDKDGNLRDVFVMMLLKPGSDPKVHPSYDWMMLGPENGKSFILETPVDPIDLFPNYASEHPKKTVQTGSKETIVGTMKKSKRPLIINLKK